MRSSNVPHFWQCLEEESKLSANSQPELRVYKGGFHPVSVDDGRNDKLGCGQGCPQVHGLASCSVFKTMRVKQKW